MARTLSYSSNSMHKKVYGIKPILINFPLNVKKVLLKFFSPMCRVSLCMWNGYDAEEKNNGTITNTMLV